MNKDKIIATNKARQQAKEARMEIIKQLLPTMESFKDLQATLFEKHGIRIGIRSLKSDVKYIKTHKPNKPNKPKKAKSTPASHSDWIHCPCGHGHKIKQMQDNHTVQCGSCGCTYDRKQDVWVDLDGFIMSEKTYKKQRKHRPKSLIDQWFSGSS